MKSETSRILPNTLRMVAWEVTRSCNLACGHCRASALRCPYEGELGTEKCMQLIDEIAASVMGIKVCGSFLCGALIIIWSTCICHYNLLNVL